MHLIRPGAFGVALVMLLAAGIRAQNRGDITGTVTDATGAAVVNASITITNIARGEALKLTTSSAGVYSASNLIPGLYSVSAEVQSFRTTTISGVEVRVGETTRRDIRLEVGQVTEKVEVVAGQELLRPDTSDIGTNVPPDAIQNLPLQVSGSSRDPIAFVRLTPGFTGTTSNSSVEYTSGFYAINGGQAGSTSVLVEGADVSLTTYSTQFNSAITMEAVDEFKVMASNFAAEYGRSTGGIINLTLKSGTNNFHGSVYDFLRNDKLDARGFFESQRLVNRQNDFGALLSGPVRIPKLYDGRNKTFFLYGFEGFRYRQGVLNDLETWPLEDFQRGDFSKLMGADGQIPIYDPSSTVLQPDGTVWRSQFAGNLIPSDRLDPVARATVSLFPKLDFPDRLTANIYARRTKATNTNINTLKVDHALSSRQKLTGSYSQASEKTHDMQPFGPLEGAGSASQIPRYARLAHDFVISPTVLNHAQFGYSRRGRKEAPDYTEDYPAQLGLKGLSFHAGFPFFCIGGYLNGCIGLGAYGNVFHGVDNSFQWNEALTVVKGKHTLKFGAEVRKQQFNVNALYNAQGNFSFSSGMTGLPGASQTTGDGFASFMLGAVGTSYMNYVGEQSGYRLSGMGLFAQDDFKVSRKLTLNLGLRYERYWPLSEATGRIATFDPTVPNPGADGRPGALIFGGKGPGRTGQYRFQEIYNRAFGPRIGLAYQLAERTVVRAGYGVYYQELKASSWGGSSLAPGFFTSAPYNSADGYTPVYYLKDGYPQDFVKPPFINPTFSNGQGTFYLDPKGGRPPIAQNWQLSVQQQLAKGMMVEVAYVGQGAHHMIVGNKILNQVDPKYLPLGSLLRANIDSPKAQAAGIVKPYPDFTGSVRQALRPFPQYMGIYFPIGSDKTGNSTYNALQAKVEARSQKGLTFLMAYTFSKVLTDGANNRDLDSYQPGQGSRQNGYNLRMEKSLAALDLTHNMVWSGLYDLPFGAKRRFLNQGAAAKLAGGWSFGGILSYHSGAPIPTPGPASSNVPLFAGGIRPDRVAGVSALTAAANGHFDPATDVYLDRAAWTSPAPYSFGNAARMIGVRTKPYLDEDISLLKATQITESVNIQLRVEAFNVLNRVVFGRPVGGLGSASFGQIFDQANRPRVMQLGLKLVF